MAELFCYEIGQMKTGEHWEKPERWNGPQERPKQPSRNERQLQKPVGDLISRRSANKTQGGGTRDSSGKRRPWKSSRGAVGNRGSCRGRTQVGQVRRGEPGWS